MFYSSKHALVHLFLLLVFTTQLNSQTIVSTSPENRRAVVEEFGGMYCVYCPHGHEILADLDEALTDNLILINHQTGPYANPIGNDPDLGNDYSEALQEQSALSGYPAATVNRHVFPGLEQGATGTTALGRGDWPEAVTLILTESAPVNLAAEASLNISTRELEVYIEYYYTADVDAETNRLHVGILQNNVLAPQHGGDTGNYYQHQHLFREFLTGQWGHIISNTSAGSFGSLTYNITLPEFYRDVWVDPVNIELAIFVTEDEQEVLNGIEVQPALESAHAADVNLIAIQAPVDVCAPELTPQIRFRNDGNMPLESCTMVFQVAGGASNNVSWSGSLAPLEEATMDLPTIFTSEDQNQVLTVELVNPNDTADPSSYNNSREHNFTVAPLANGSLFELALRTDEFGYEVYWEIVDALGTIYASGGNELVGETNGGAQIATPSDPGAYSSNEFVIEEFFLPFEGCYELRILDDYADGLCCFYGNGFFRLRLPGQAPILEGAEFGALDESHFSINFEVTSSNELVTDIPISIYPNPLQVGQPLSIQWPTEAPAAYSWQLLRADGSTVANGNEAALPNSSSLPSGYYVFQLHFAEELIVLPLIIAE